MIGYVVLGSNDLDRARAFYDQLMPVVGAGRMFEFGDNFTMYGSGMGKPGLAVAKPHDGKTATAGNGNMAAIVVDSRDQVDSLYAKALELGGTCEGPPGVRGDDGDQAFYGAYFRDLDGNKLAVFTQG